MDLKKKALELGASYFGRSNRKDKRYVVIYDNKKIHFGKFGGNTFIDHHDLKKRNAWRNRHSKIKNKKGEYVYLLKSSPSYWAWNLLWP